MEFRKVYNDTPSAYVKSAAPIYSFMGFGKVKQRDRQGEKDQEKYQPRKRVKDYFRTLAKATETSNQQLEEKGVPFRFCVFEKDDRVLIDFVILDAKGKVKESQTKDITNEDFNLWIDNVSRIEGLNIDKTG